MFLDTLDVSFGPMKVTEYRFSVRFKKPPGIRDFVTLLKKVVYTPFITWNLTVKLKPREKLQQES